MPTAQLPELRRQTDRLQLRFDAHIEPVRCLLDPDSFLILFRNVIDNAFRHTPSSGTVQLPCRVDGAQACMIVADSGPGIPAAMRERVFDWFVRLSNAGTPGCGTIRCDACFHNATDPPSPQNFINSRTDAMRHTERHRTQHIGWLRAAVLGANDGIVSTASLIVGVAAASSSQGGILMTGVAGLVAGAMSMAAGEYISVHSQADTERADLERERKELDADPASEHRELAAIYMARGVERKLAQQVAEQLMAHDDLGAHARDELGISNVVSARPVQAALASAASFALGALLPLVVTALAPQSGLISYVGATSLAFLASLGAVAARVGGANVLIGALRVTFWGALAMVITAGVGKIFGAVI